MKKINFKNLKFSANNTVIIVFSLVFVILLNVLAQTAQTRFPFLKLDCTEVSFTKISDETKNFLNTLEDDITILAFEGKEPLHGDVEDVLEQYAAYSKNVDFEKVNYHQKPEMIREYSIESDYAQNSVVVINERTGRKEVITENEMVTIVDNGATSFVLENKLTNAINFLTIKKVVTIAMTEGHGEADTTVLEGVLAESRIGVLKTDLLTEEIPDNADILMIMSPLYDFTAYELDKIDDFLKSGGALALTLSPGVILERFESYLSEWGAEVGNDVVFETDSSSSYQEGGILFFAQNGDHPVISNVGKRVFASYGRSIAFESVNDVEGKVIFSTSDFGACAPADVASTETTKVGKFNIGYLLERPVDGSFEKTGKILLTTTPAVWGVAAMRQEEMAMYALVEPNFGNRQFVENAVSYLSDMESAIINVPGKTTGTHPMSISQSAGNILANTFTVIIPLIILIAGIIVWLRRRNK